jgi:hypothetical protein
LVAFFFFFFSPLSSLFLPSFIPPTHPGRLVVRQLLESNLDATIVAFVRDYDKVRTMIVPSCYKVGSKRCVLPLKGVYKRYSDVFLFSTVHLEKKAIRVLYDDMVVLKRNNKKHVGPKLQIVEGNLVPPQELPGYNDDDQVQRQQDDDDEWMKRAQSAAAFYGKSIEDFNDDGASSSSSINRNSDSSSSTGSSSGDESSLQEAIRGCTTIISCVGSVRPTNLWTDILARPVIRLWQHDVSRWCTDARHPYYVAYATTRKALELAEREQLRREMAVAAAAITAENNESDHHDASNAAAMLRHSSRDKNQIPPRIRFIRISDLCVAQKPWQFIPVLTNMFHSMVFRYQDMAERLLESSALIDTVVLRPGDLVDDERDIKTTSLQVNPSGRVPTPARVGRGDVAALAVAAALFQSEKKTSMQQQQLMRNSTDSSTSRDHQHQNQPTQEQQQKSQPPIHYTLAVRWTGGAEAMSPYPAQGSRKNGLPTATLCMQAALKSLRTQEKRKANSHSSSSSLQKSFSTSSSSSYSETVLEFAKSKLQQQRRKKQKLKPWGIFVTLPVYFCLFLMLRNMISIIYMALSYVPGFTTRVAPAMARLIGTVAALVHYLCNHVGSLAQAFLPEQVAPLIPKWLRMRHGSPTYITL